MSGSDLDVFAYLGYSFICFPLIIRQIFKEVVHEEEDTDSIVSAMDGATYKPK